MRQLNLGDKWRSCRGAYGGAKRTLSRTRSALVTRYQVWAAGLVEQPLLFVLTVGMEAYSLLILLASATAIGMRLDEETQNLIVMLFWFLVFLQLNSGWTNLTNPHYIIKMAKKAGELGKKHPRMFSDAMLSSSGSLRALVRAGRRMSGGNFEAILLSRLHDMRPNEEHKVRLKEILSSIEMQMARDFSRREPANCPDRYPSAFFERISSLMAREQYVAEDIADIVLKQYLMLEASVKGSRRSMSEPPPIASVQLMALRWQIIGIVTSALLLPILQILAPGIIDWLFPK